MSKPFKAEEIFCPGYPGTFFFHDILPTLDYVLLSVVFTDNHAYCIFPMTSGMAGISRIYMYSTLEQETCSEPSVSKP